MTRYELFLFVHVLAAAAWVGAALFIALVTELALRAEDRSALVHLLEYDDKLAPILYIPALILVLGAGIGLVLDGPWGFGEGWVVAGIVLLAAVFLLGVAILLPAAKRVRDAVEASGVDSPETRARLQAFRLFSWLDVAVLAAVIFVMTTKPF